MNTLIIFSLLTICNVVLSTIKSIVTIKCGKTAASLISAGYYGFYNIVLIYTVSDFPLYQKVLVTFFCNLIGVYTVKFFEEKLRKDKLWKVEATIPKEKANDLLAEAVKKDLSFNYVDIQKYILFNFYCPTQKDSIKIKKLLNKYNAKYFVAESKNL